MHILTQQALEFTIQQVFQSPSAHLQKEDKAVSSFSETSHKSLMNFGKLRWNMVAFFGNTDVKSSNLGNVSKTINHSEKF